MDQKRAISFLCEAGRQEGLPDCEMGPRTSLPATYRGILCLPWTLGRKKFELQACATHERRVLVYRMLGAEPRAGLYGKAGATIYFIIQSIGSQMWGGESWPEYGRLGRSLPLPLAASCPDCVGGSSKTPKELIMRRLYGKGREDGFYIAAWGFFRTSSLGPRWVSPLGQQVLFPAARHRKAATVLILISRN